jgi:phage recombination protein Bet
MSETAVQQYKLSNGDIDTLVQVGVIPKDTPASAISMYAKFCAESNLSPFKKQVHLVKRWTKDGDRYTIQTGIDGYRAIANRTGQYAGNDDYRFDEGLTEYEAVKNKRNPPTTATATVYRIVSGVRCPFSSTARWDEYVQQGKNGVSPMWAKMPYLMLGKCAEALALRKAFPEEIGGVYTDEEMQQAEVVEIPKQPAQSGKVQQEPIQDAVVVEKKPVDDDSELKVKAIKAIHNAKDIKTLDKIEAQAHKYHTEGKITTKTFDEIGVELTTKQFELSPLGEK